jgi:ParB family chromosome partitioning protein
MPPPAPAGPSVQSLAVVQIRPNPFQPRHTFRAEALEELTASIQEKGILQPLIVRRTGQDYQIVAGERRWRAAQQAGLKEVPVIVRAYTDQEMLELALIENLQREELSAVEEARAYRQLVEEFEMTQEAVAERVGKSRVAVTNALRLLRLPRVILDWVDEGKVSAGHARALLSLESEPLQMALSREIMGKGLSVREVEKRVRRLLKGAAPSVKAKVPVIEIDTRDLQEKLTLHLGLQVKIFPTSNTSGKIEVAYSSLDEFQRFFDHVGISFEQDV